MGRKIAASALPMDAKGKAQLVETLEELMEREGELSDWERGCVDSLYAVVTSDRFVRLSDAQYEVYEEICGRYGV